MSCVYKIENNKNGKFYIGSTTHYQRRKNKHLSQLRNNKHINAKLQNAFNKYGEVSFDFSVIETCDSLVEREQHYLDFLKPYYNLFMTAYAVTGENHPMFGRKHSQEAKNKIKAARSKQVISHSAETRNKIGSKHKGKTADMLHMKKMIAARNGKSWNEGIKTGIEPVNKIKMDSTPIIDFYSKGDSIETIRRRLKISWDTVKRILTENKIIIRNISQQKTFK